MLAFLFPITLDGLILAGSLLILYFAVRGKRSGYGLFLTALGVVASIAGNVVISPNDLTYQILHGTSPVVLFLALESLMILLRARSRNAQEAFEKEAAEKKLLSDGYFHHRTAESEPKAVEVTPEVSMDKTIPKTLSAPANTSQKPPSVLSPSPAMVEEDKMIQAPIVIENVEPVRTLGLGKHSSLPSAVDVPKVTETVPSLVTPVTTQDLNENNISDNQGPSKREIIRDLLLKNPEMEASEIIDIVGGDRKYVQKLIRAERAKITS